jgi:hypothetical protein
MDGQDGVAGIVRVIEQGPELGLLEVLLEPAGSGGDVGFDVLALGGELGEDLELFLLAEDLLEELEVLFEELLLLLKGLRGLLVLPDRGRAEPGVYRLPLGGLAIEVKENLGPLRLSRRGRSGGS